MLSSERRGRRRSIRRNGVTISGTPDAIEDFLDARLIDERLAEARTRQPIPWDELKARRGL
jgi:hypothetical protein